MLRGAYQFFEPGRSDHPVADQFLAKVGMLGAGRPPVALDVEVTGGQSAATIARHMETVGRARHGGHRQACR